MKAKEDKSPRAVPLKPIENPRLYRQIADQIARLITSGELARGARLPSERDLAVQLGVSRPSVREALIALEVAGKVDVRVGSGIYVATGRPALVLSPASEGEGPFEHLRARHLIEGEIAKLAAREARAEDLKAIRDALLEMQRERRRGANGDEADRHFHLAIARASHNSVLVSVVQDLWDRGRGALWKRMEDHFQTPRLRAAVTRDHHAILEALERKDGRDARRAMHAHLDRVEREFSRHWNLQKEVPSRAVAARAAKQSP